MFLVCVVNPILKIGDTTNILYQPRFHADRSSDHPTDKSCLHFSFDFMGLYCFTYINLELIRNSLLQPRFHAGILVQEIKYALSGLMARSQWVPYPILSTMS